jgi:nucleotide-binding universal stress UspA family protein
MHQKNKRILVAIDGSTQSLNAVRYLSKLPFSSKPKVVLFHVIRRIDQAFWDIGVSPMSRGQMVEFKKNTMPVPVMAVNPYKIVTWNRNKTDAIPHLAN